MNILLPSIKYFKLKTLKLEMPSFENR